MSCSLEVAASFTEGNWGAQSTTVLLLINIFTQTVSHLGPEQVSGTPQQTHDKALAQRWWGAAQEPCLSLTSSL